MPAGKAAAMTKGEATKEKILETAESLILENGYGATSLEQIQEAVGITKSGFIYHFPNKHELAVSLLERYLVNDRVFFQSLIDRAVQLSEDPFQQMLLFLKLMAESMKELPDVHPGCLVATFTYESLQVNDTVRELNEQALLEWRKLFKDQLDKIDVEYDKNLDVDNDTLADMLTALVEGGIILSRALNSQALLPEQILQHRNYLRLLYKSRP